MKNQHTQKQETSVGQGNKVNGRIGLPKAFLGSSIIVFAFTVICLMMSSCASTSRPSTSAEIAEQMKFQEKWNTEHEEAEQK